MNANSNQRFSLRTIFVVVAYFALLAMGLSLPTTWWVDNCVLATLLVLLWLWRCAWSTDNAGSRVSYRNAALFGTAYFAIIFLLLFPSIWEYMPTSKWLAFAHDQIHGVTPEEPPQSVAEFIASPRPGDVQVAVPNRYWPFVDINMEPEDTSLRGFSSVGHCFFTTLFVILGGIRWRRLPYQTA